MSRPPSLGECWVPKRLVAGTAVVGLEHLTAFVLLHVDGVATVSQIAYATGLPHEEVVAMLEELCSREIVCFERLESGSGSSSSGRLAI